AKVWPPRVGLGIRQCRLAATDTGSGYLRSPRLDQAMVRRDPRARSVADREFQRNVAFRLIRDNRAGKTAAETEAGPIREFGSRRTLARYSRLYKTPFRLSDLPAIGPRRDGGQGCLFMKFSCEVGTTKAASPTTRYRS